MSVVRINEFTSKEGQSQALFEFLKALIPYISQSQGCLSCEVLKQQDNENCFVVIEKWQNITDHTQSIAGFPREKMEAVVPLLECPPTGRYFIS